MVEVENRAEVIKVHRIRDDGFRKAIAFGTFGSFKHPGSLT